MSTIISLTKALYISMYWNSTTKGMKFGRGYGWLSCGVYGNIGTMLCLAMPYLMQKKYFV